MSWLNVLGVISLVSFTASMVIGVQCGQPAWRSWSLFAVGILGLAVVAGLAG